MASAGQTGTSVRVNLLFRSVMIVFVNSPCEIQMSFLNETETKSVLFVERIQSMSDMKVGGKMKEIKAPYST
jgi:hypothetical protein